MENISQIKAGFVDYLIDKYGDEESSKINSYSPEVSIFMYSHDFQDYLVDNGYADVSIFGKSISDIKNLLATSGENTNADASEGTNSEYSEGDTFMLSALTEAFSQDEDLFAAVNTNSNETVDIEEITAFLDSVEAAMAADPDSYENIFDGIAKGIQNIKGGDTEVSIDDVLESIYNSEAALEYLDLDGDGKISDLEKELFESYIQGDNEELKQEDLEKALEEMANGTFKYDVSLPEDAENVADIEGTTASESDGTDGNVSARQSADPAQSASPTGRTSGGSSIGGGGNTVQQTPSNINEMNLDQLKTEQTKRKSNVDNAKSKVDDTVSEIDDVKTNEYPDAKEAYDEAVENDENISEELKTRREDNLAAIEATTDEITSLSSQIAETEVALGEANDALDADNKNLSALKSALASFDSAEDQDAVAEQKAAIQSQIDTLEQTTIPAHEEERDRLEELLNGGGESEGLKDQLQTKEAELDELEKERAEIEKEISETGNEETQKALENFQAVEKKLDDLMTELSSAREALTDAQEQLDDVNELIRTKEADSLERENSYYNGNIPKELASALDAKLGAGFCAKLEQVARNINCDPADLLGMMQSESGINPKAYNNHGGATGLIQFMPSTAQSLGTSTNALLNMSALDQLDYVEKYFTNWTGGSGQRLSAGDLYTLCFLPAYLNKDVLCEQGSVYYNSNSGLDTNHDGRITKDDLTQRVQGKYQEVLKQYGIS